MKILNLMQKRFMKTSCISVGVIGKYEYIFCIGTDNTANKLDTPHARSLKTCFLLKVGIIMLLIYIKLCMIIRTFH